MDLATRAAVGVEALARGPAGTALEFPDALFTAARTAGRLGELDLLCTERALECALAAPVRPPLLFINAEPAVLSQPLSPRLIELAAGGLPFRYVLEFTERAVPAAPASLLHIAGVVHQWGNGLALDDVGVDPMSLAFLPVLEPEVIKLDMGLVRNPHAPHTQEVCAVVRAEAARTGAVVLAEGIESDDDLRTARSLGAHQGLGRRSSGASLPELFRSWRLAGRTLMAYVPLDSSGDGYFKIITIDANEDGTADYALVDSNENGVEDRAEYSAAHPAPAGGGGGSTVGTVVWASGNSGTTFGPGAEVVMDGNAHTINTILTPEGYEYVPKDY